MLHKVFLKTCLLTTGENGADEIRSECYGACVTEGNDVMLRYAEPDNDGTAHLLITDGLADLKRQGNTRARFTFVEGKLQPCFYATSVGTLDLSIFTHSLSFQSTPQGGTFEVRYTVLVGGAQVSDNVLRIVYSFR